MHRVEKHEFNSPDMCVVALGYGICHVVRRFTEVEVSLESFVLFEKEKNAEGR